MSEPNKKASTNRLTRLRAVAWAWYGLAAFVVWLVIDLTVKQAQKDSFPEDLGQFVFLSILFLFNSGLLCVVARGIQRYSKFAWSLIVGLSAQGALACVVLPFTDVPPPNWLHVFAIGLVFSVFSLVVLLTKEVRSRVWQPAASESTDSSEKASLSGGSPEDMVIKLVSMILVGAVFLFARSHELPPHWMRGILLGLLAIAAVAALPFLYIRKDLATRLLGMLAAACAIAYFRLKVQAMVELNSWVSLLDNRLFVYTAGVVMALAVFHMAIHLFGRNKTDTGNASYTMTVLLAAMLCSMFSVAGATSLAVVVLTGFGAAFLYGLYAGFVQTGRRWLRVGHGVAVGALLLWELSLTLYLAPFTLIALATVQVWGVSRKVDGSGILSIGVIGYVLAGIWSLLPVEFLGDLGFLYGTVVFTGSMSVFMARTFVRTLSDNARKTQELEEARRLQLSLLPDAVPTTPGVEIAWHMETATEVGGDYYDYSISDDGTLTRCVGDATGHGMDSGVIVTGTKSLFQTFADAPSITDSLTVMSRSLKGMDLPRMGMAMTLLRMKESTCRVSSAGMPPVLIYRASSREVEEIDVSGYPLGMSDKATYQEETFEVSSGDVILMMSDGLPERLNPQDEYFDYDRTKAVFAEAATGTPEELCDGMLQSAEEWADGRPQDDDITLVALKAK